MMLQNSLKLAFFSLFLGSAAAACSGSEGDSTTTDSDGTDSGTDNDGATSSGGSDGTGGTTTVGDCGNCDNGCCDGDTCVPFASQDADQCGSDNNVCATCGAGQLCDSVGQCATDWDECSPLTCSFGCCEEDQCINATDWNSCGEGGESCGACSYGVECSTEGLCTDTIHDDAIFLVAVTSVQLEQTNLGALWDAVDPPEPYVCISNGVEEDCTDAECDNQLSCDFDLSGELAITFTGAQLKSEGIVITVWDYDGVSDDLAGTTTALLATLKDTYAVSGFGAVSAVNLTLR